MSQVRTFVILVLALLLGACSSLDSKRNDALKEVQGEQIALNNQIATGLVQPGSPQYYNEVRRVRQRWVDNYLPVVDSGFAKHNALVATLNDSAASASTRASASTELAELRQQLYQLLQETTLFNQQVVQDAAAAQQVGYAWHLDYPKCPNTPPAVFTATAVEQIPQFQLAAAAPAQPTPVQYVPLAPAAPQGASAPGQATSIPLGS